MIRSIFTATTLCALLGPIACTEELSVDEESTSTEGSSGETGADPHWCLEDDSHVPRHQTAAGLEFVRTPEQAFANLPGYDFAPNYIEIDGLRMHYVDEGPRDGEVILLLHGEPSWAYLYRKMIVPLAEAGYRVIATDHIGMGRSDKPVDIAVHTYEQHVAWTWAMIEGLGLDQITLFAQDWGGLIGLRVAGDHPERFARIVAANTQLPVIPEGQNPFVVPENPIVDCELGEWQPGEFQNWLEYALLAPNLTPSVLVEALTLTTLTPAIAAAYNAPYPTRTHKAAIRAFPSMIAAVEQNNAAAWAALGNYDKPFLALAGVYDTSLGSEDVQNSLVAHIPGSRFGYHDRFEAHHFIQEDIGEQLAASVSFFMRKNPLDFPGCWAPDPSPQGFDCEALCDNIVQCSPQHPRGICVQSCELVAPYLTDEAAAAVAPCIASPACETHETWGTALDGCMVPLITSGQIAVPEGNAAHCETLASSVAACDPSSQFANVCSGLSFVYTPESMAKMSACADRPCGELSDCIVESNCAFLFDDRGALPERAPTQR